MAAANCQTKPSQLTWLLDCLKAVTIHTHRHHLALVSIKADTDFNINEPESICR